LIYSGPTEIVDLSAECAQIIQEHGWDAQPAWCFTPAATGLGAVPGTLDYYPPAVSIPGIPNPVQAPMPNPATFQKIPIDLGPDGTMQTLQAAGNLALQNASDPFFIDEARSIVRPCAGRDYRCYAQSIFDYVLGRDEQAQGVPRVVYREQPIATDENGVPLFNMVASPGALLFLYGGGLCLDLSTLISSLDLANGLGAAMRAVWLAPRAPTDEASHVYPIALTKDGDFAQDVVPPDALLGQEPPSSIWTRPPIDYVIALP
jgi:hypothetical protein